MNFFSHYKIIPIINVSDIKELEDKLTNLKNINHKIIEIVFRKENSLEILKFAKSNYKDFTIGVGTVYDIKTLEKILNVGADFIISPGYSEKLIKYVKDNNIEFIPGAITAGEIIQLIENDFKLIKIFPIDYFGGIKYMKTLDSIFSRSNVKFIPTGGINSTNVKEYLKLESVIACSSSSFIEEISK